MFEIPENLPRNLAPLAWVLGRWQGWGMLAKPEGEDDQIILQDITADIVGSHMRMVTTLYFGSVEGGIDPLLGAKDGLDLIVPGDFFREETSYWHLVSPLAMVPAEGEEPREMQVSSSDTQDLSILWAGVVMGPRIRLASDVIARSAQAPQMDFLHRMYGLVAGELMWTSEITVGDEDPAVELSGRLQRIASAGASESA